MNIVVLKQASFCLQNWFIGLYLLSSYLKLEEVWGLNPIPDEKVNWMNRFSIVPAHVWHPHWISWLNGRTTKEGIIICPSCGSILLCHLCIQVPGYTIIYAEIESLLSLFTPECISNLLLDLLQLLIHSPRARGRLASFLPPVIENTAEQWPQWLPPINKDQSQVWGGGGDFPMVLWLWCWIEHQEVGCTTGTLRPSIHL